MRKYTGNSNRRKSKNCSTRIGGLRVNAALRNAISGAHKLLRKFMLYRREGFPGEDELVLCTVTKVLPHVVFVNIDEYDKGGLVHISEIAPGRIRNIREYVELGKKIVCKVLRVDQAKGHIDLSLRRVSEIERKKKLEEIKQEQKAEKIVELVATQTKRKVHEVYETITAKVFERYPFIYLFFKDVAIGKASCTELIADAQLAQA